MAEESQTPAVEGRRFGRYTLLEAIDRGGMAEVYRAVSQGPGGFQRQFVIKRIRKEKASSRDFVEMFVNEARISALLEHPNIVQVYDFGQVDGDYFLAMEYLRGRNLLAVGRRLRKQHRPVPADLTAYVGREVARGLHYAHTLSNMGQPLGIVHRDVSPSNIMLLKTGGVKLLDFGIARATMKLRALTPIGGLIKGKLSYLSPEQVKGGGAVDGRSDIFSLGIVMWEALTGMRLFFHPNDLDTMRNVLHRPVPKPSELRPDVPPALDAVVTRALQRDPADRYPDGAAMASDLEDYLRDVRYSPESLVRLLGELFAGEDTGRELPLPEEAVSIGRPSGGMASVSSPSMAPISSAGSLSPPPELAPPAAPEEDQGYATVSAVHRLAEMASRQRRKRIIQISSVAGVALGAIGLFALTRGPAQAPARPHAALAPATLVVTPPAPGTEQVAQAIVPNAEVAVAEVPKAEPPPATKPSVPPPAEPEEAASESRPRRAASPSAPAVRSKRALAEGLEALAKGEYMHAADQLEEATLANPQNAQALAGLAEAEFELAHYARAVTFARKATALAPRNPRYQTLLGDSYFKLDRFREASAAYTAAALAAPGDASIKERKARVDSLLEKLEP